MTLETPLMPLVPIPFASNALTLASVPALQEHAAGLASTTNAPSQIIVGVIIVSLFVLLTLEAAHRVLVAMVSAALLWAVTYFTPFHLISFEASVRALDMNVLFLLAGMMTVVGVLKATGAFEWAVGRLVVRARGQARLAARLLSWFTGIASAFLDNVTTVIFVTPMAMGMSRRMGLSPIAMLLPMVIASNIGGTATLIGDPPNIMIGSPQAANLSFVAFLKDLTAPVLIMMVVLQWYLAWYFRDEYAAAPGLADAAEEQVQLKDPRLFRWMAAISVGILIGFLTHSLTGMPPAIPAVLGAAAALAAQDILYLKTVKPTAEDRAHGILKVIEQDIEWPTLAFFVFLFIIVGAAVQTGLIGSVAHGMSWTIHRVRASAGLGDEATLLFAALLICWMSAVLSAFIDNIPYVAVSIPVIYQLSTVLPGDTSVLWWALSLGACLGGNATVIGASANVTTVGLAEKEGLRIGFREYSRFAAPITTLTILISSAFITSYIYLGRTPARELFGVLAAVLVTIEILHGRKLAKKAGALSRA